MKRLLHILLLLILVLPAAAQKRKVQNKPYIDFRPLHFGLLVGLNLQDAELTNVGPQLITMPDGTEKPADILCDADMWTPGFSVGVLADMRINNHFSWRVTPSMHFGSKRLLFLNLLADENDPKTITQDLKNTYISVPIDVKFAAQRFNNYRPYIMAGINPMLNLTSKEQAFVQLRRYDAMVEVGLGCDFYLPFFKFIPELKFCYSLFDTLDRDRWSELSDINKRSFAQCVNSVHTKMIVLTLYFE
ncbi:MAG: PorT family protein [Prevotella sp.]|nr:PorT family protein [Prevotella sp.]